MRRLSAGLCLLLAGCGSGAAGRAPVHPAHASVDGCVHLGPHARRVAIHPAGDPPIDGVLIGRGRTAFVLTNESDENLCAWLPFVRTLNRHGYAALLYDYASPSDLPGEARAAARATGARRIVLMGASVGARGSLRAATTHPRGVVAVVSLSAERSVRSDPGDLVPRARHVAVPTLLVSARADPFTLGATRPLLRALAAHRKRALVVPGDDHGTALLTGAHGHRVVAAILAFVAG